MSTSTQLIRGKGVTLFVDVGSVGAVWKPLGCATGFSMDITRETIETTTINNGVSKSYVRGMEDMTGSFEGVITLDENPVAQFDELIDLMSAERGFMVKFENDYGDTLVYTLSAVITKVSMTAPVTDFTGFNVDFIRSGAWIKQKIYNNILVDNLGNPILDSDGYFIRVT